MMQFIRSNKRLAFLIAIAALIVIGYVLFRPGGGSENPLTKSSTGGSPPQSIGRELLVTLGDLRLLTLDGSIFTDPVFMSLQDFSVPLPTLPAGRRNPFAPLGSDASPQGQGAAPSR